MIKGILLAAGQSRRLKNENKLIKIFKDKPLIHHALNSAKNSKINQPIRSILDEGLTTSSS